MTADKFAFLADLAKGNPVDLEKIAEVDRHLAELRRAGIVTEHRFQLNSPLGNPTRFEPRRVLANAIPLASSTKGR